MSYKQKSPLAILEGGTNTQSFLHAFGVAYYDGGALNNIDPGLNNYVLTSNGTSAPSFQVVSASGAVTTIDGNSGAATPSSGVLTISGSGPISTSGSSATLSVTTTAANVINASSGSATASSNAFTIVGASGITTSATGSTLTITGSGVTQGIVTIDGSTGSVTGTTVSIQGTNSNIVTSGSGTAFTIALANSPSVSGSVTAGTGLVATTGGLTVSAGTITTPFTSYGALVSNTSGVITDAASTAGYVLTGNSGSVPTFQAISASGAVTSVNGNSGTATPSSGVLTISGSGPIATSGSGATLSVTTTAANTINASTGSATASSNAFTIVGASGITTSATGSTLTITGSGVTQGIVTIDGSTGSVTGTTVTLNGGTTGLTTTGSSTTMSLGGTLVLANGGTSASLTASNGGIFYSTASAGAILAGTATANQVLMSGASTTPAWSTATYPASTTINQLLYSSANNVVGGVTAGNYGVLISSSSGVPSWLANGTTGQVLTATTGGTPSWAAGGGGSSFTWNDQTTSTVTIAAANGYIMDDGASLITATLPSSAVLGAEFKIVGKGSGLWTIAQNSGQSIRFGSFTTTVGTGGSLSSTLASDCVSVVCTTANTVFTVYSSMGNLTVV